MLIYFLSYQNAEKSMRRAFERIKNISNRNSFKEWEPLFNNLGHVCRKLRYNLFTRIVKLLNIY